jgi:outer membrane protein assembly factor BamB
MVAESPSVAPAENAILSPVVRPAPKPRLWPGLVLIGLYWLACAVVYTFFSGTFTQFMTIFWSPILLAAGVLIWLAFLSRLPWRQRCWILGCLVVGGALAWLTYHKSMAFGLLMTALPMAITAVVLLMAVTRGAGTRAGWLGVAAASLLSWGYFALIRFDGITGGMQAKNSWRWSKTPEDVFLEQRLATEAKDKTPAESQSATETLLAGPADWPEFRGARRDGHVRDVSLPADWAKTPPHALWRRRVGPGWSSFSVVSNRGFTQEQRGEQEAVVCFDLTTGRELWSHEDKARFEEAVGGAGPRATPTFVVGRLYALGGSGVLNCLDAATGKPHWSQDISKDADARPPMWGFSSSPLVADGLVIVFAGGKDGKSVLAYDAESGELRWSGGKGKHSYSSCQLQTIGGQSQVLMVSDYGLESFEPTTGKLLWEHEWTLKDMFRVCQPHIVGEGQVLLGTGMGYGTRLLEITKNGDAWKVAEKWTTKDLKPYFNDCVSRDGYLYGYDGEILACLELASGKRKWKKGRYGYGQILLVGDAGQLLIVSEQGELVLAEATPSGLTELFRFQAVPGKTWNHPVIANGKLLVRNGEEMACYDLSGGAALARAE